jgi:hypothetical protein
MDNNIDCSAPIITRGKLFQPTPILRFIERLVPTDEHTAITVRVLQQKWADMNSQESEWRDVPLEEEESNE